MNPTALRVLYVLPYLPSPIRVRPYQLIRALAKAGHRITVVALADEFADVSMATELRTLCEAVHVVPHPRPQATRQALLALPTPVPLWAAYCFSEAMADKIRGLVATGAFDVAHVEHLRAAHFASALAPLPVVFDAVDCITALRKQMMESGNGSLASRLLSWEEWHKLRTYEPRLYRLFDQAFVTSEQDIKELRQLGVDSPPLHVIPNGVDADYFCPDSRVVPEQDTLVFSGKMSYEANQDAANFLLKEILPRLRQSRPEAKVILVGSSPSNALKSLAARTGGVTVTGFVEDIRPALLRATVAVCPMRIGVGMQNKVLEAMAVGRPVVCSPIAARALPESVGVENGVFVAETADAFARVCADLLTRPAHEVAASGRSARAYVEPRYRWSTAAVELVRLYHIVIAGRESVPASLRELATGAVL